MNLATIYPAIETSLQQANAQYQAAAAHGMLCAVLSTTADSDGWQPLLFEEYDPANLQQSQVVQQLAALSNYSQEQLSEQNMGFRLLLPDDEESLESRVSALAAWCDGFLSGLATNAESVQKLQQLSNESNEFIHDLTQLRRCEMTDEAEEEGEAAYVELVEYLRVGVMSLYEEFRE